ncbi:thioredoxin 2 [Phycicoccus badiiscoriae]|uniref:Thioredoxin n=1 Tax=Pedococcus badiiscoriae TaxID=642776 RepID=A0A852WFF7_9MICO|nr:thioredoxin [Pedococcus badiiscoriae]NYG07963.1 thioredoxin 2 [Pedococcus badiiscoriae]
MNTTLKGPTTIVVCANCGTKNRVPAVAGGAPRCGKCRNPLAWVVDTSDADFAAVVDRSTIPVLVDVWAPWCGPCRMVSPALEQLATELAGKLKLVKVNADEAPEVSRRFEVQAIPTLVLMNRGQVVVKQVGAAPVPALRSWLTQHLPKEDPEPDRSSRDEPSGRDDPPTQGARQ